MTSPQAPVGPLWPKAFDGHLTKPPGRWPRGSPEEAPKVTVETLLAMANTNTLAFGPTVETQLMAAHEQCLLWPALKYCSYFLRCESKSTLNARASWYGKTDAIVTVPITVYTSAEEVLEWRGRWRGGLILQERREAETYHLSSIHRQYRTMNWNKLRA